MLSSTGYRWPLAFQVCDPLPPASIPPHQEIQRTPVLRGLQRQGGNVATLPFTPLLPASDAGPFSLSCEDLEYVSISWGGG